MIIPLFGYTNTYLIVDKKTILIDPGMDYEFKEKLNIIKKYVNNVDMIILTHGHYDHYSSAYLFEKKYDCQTYIHKKDLKYLTNKEDPSLKLFGVKDPKIPKKLITNMDLNFIKIIETPGHTMGSISILYGKYLIVGDLIFREGIGRWDLGGDPKILEKSISKIGEIIKKENIKLIYPGHGIPIN